MSDRVHIICARASADRVLPRQARQLADGLGWSLSEHPDPSADFNYGAVYLDLAQDHPGWHETPLGCWFSHYDRRNPRKMAIWDAAASAVDLRTTTAEQYAAMLRPLGLTRIVTPGIELDRFTPRVPEAVARPVVGVSGYTYNDGRKGEALVERLVRSPLARDIELRGSGRGWDRYGIPTRGYPWNEMHEYFQSLDVYLCTSLIEGIPMPPLEAMACGVPCVIPRGVGLLDELPAVQNLYRYQAGDYDSMEAALEIAVEAARRGPHGVNVASLRAIASRFTVERWCEEHRAAVDALLHPSTDAPSAPPPWQGRAGVYVVAYGDPARECASLLLRSIRRHMPGLPVCLVSDRPLGGEDIFREFPDDDVAARDPKTRIYDLSPSEWEYVLYLDADCELMGDVSFFFDALEDGWELLFCESPGKYAVLREATRPDNHEEHECTVNLTGTPEVLQLAGGVFAFRRTDGTARLMRSWHREWERWAGRDQGALMRAYYTSPVKLYLLPVEWNASDRYVPPERCPVIVHHQMAARRWKPGTFLGRTTSAEAWAAVHPTGRP